MNEIMVHLVGNVATPPTLRLTPAGRPVTSFRLAATPRRFDAERGWQDQPTSWVTVTCWNGLAENASLCLNVGHPVVLVGRLRVREWERDGRKGQEVEVEALGLGHDLHRGVSIYKKTARAQRPEEASVGVDPGDEPLDPFDPADPTGPGAPADPTDPDPDAGRLDGDGLPARPRDPLDELVDPLGELHAEPVR